MGLDDCDYRGYRVGLRAGDVMNVGAMEAPLAVALFLVPLEVVVGGKMFDGLAQVALRYRVCGMPVVLEKPSRKDQSRRRLDQTSSPPKRR